MPVEVKQVGCRCAMNRSGIEGIDWCINPFVGCSHACAYCYASFMKRFTGHDEPWGSFVDVKTNLLEVLSRQLCRPHRGKVMLSSVTDPYQPVEGEALLTRGCLRLLLESDLSVSILTKSDLVLRDLDLLVGFGGLLDEQRVEVGFSLITLDEHLAKALEPGAASPGSRLAALERLASAGIPTWLFISPILPGLTDEMSNLEAVVSEARQRGARDILFDPLNFYAGPTARLERLVGRIRSQGLSTFRRARDDQSAWKSRISSTMAKLMVNHC